MKKLIIFILVIFSSQFLFASQSSRLEQVDWDKFSKNIVKGLTMNNDGVRQACMKHIITYSAYLDVNDAVFDIVKIYRYHKDDRYRQLAVVALNKIQNKWSMYFLKRSIKFEQNPTIKRQILDGLYRYQKEEMAAKGSEVTRLLAELE